MPPRAGQPSGLIGEAKARGTAILGIFHDEDVRERVADRLLPLDGSLGGLSNASQPCRESLS